MRKWGEACLSGLRFSPLRPRSFIVHREQFFEIVESFLALCVGHPAFLNGGFDDVPDTGRVGSGLEQVDNLVEIQSGFPEFGPVMLKGIRELCGGGQTGRPLPIVNGGLPVAGQGHVWQDITVQGASSPLCTFPAFSAPAFLLAVVAHAVAP
jgi:hypothetical protein